MKLLIASIVLGMAVTAAPAGTATADVNHAAAHVQMADAGDSFESSDPVSDPPDEEPDKPDSADTSAEKADGQEQKEEAQAADSGQAEQEAHADTDPQTALPEDSDAELPETGTTEILPDTYPEAADTTGTLVTEEGDPAMEVLAEEQASDPEAADRAEEDDAALSTLTDAEGSSLTEAEILTDGAAEALMGVEAAGVTDEVLNGWTEIDQKKYYYENGVPVTGFTDIDGAVYHFDEDGSLTVGAAEIDGSRYYFGADGKMKTGFVNIDQSQYYFDGEGKMTTGWQKINGFRYNMGTDGAILTGWQTIDGNHYYFYPATDKTKKQYKGTAVRGFFNWKTGQYYFDASNAMALGWQKINGFRYNMGTDGKILTGWQTIDGKKYYFYPATDKTRKQYKGTAAKGFFTWNKSQYYFNDSNAMTLGWQKINGFRYNMGTDGKIRTGWQTIDGKTYYFYPVTETARGHYKGTAAVGHTMIGDKLYYFLNDGVKSNKMPTMTLTAIDFVDGNYWGDATLLYSNGKYLLIDTGRTDSKHKYVINYLKKKGVRKLDIYISHYHEDHFGNARFILNDSYFTVGTIYLPDHSYMENKTGKYFAERNDLYNKMIKAANAKGVKKVYLKKGSSFTIGDCTAKVLYMEGNDRLKEEKRTGVPKTDEDRDDKYVNNRSLVTMFTCGEIRYLNCGDIEYEVEKKILDQKIDVKADIFKMSHHGGNSSNKGPFQKAVNARFVYHNNLNCKDNIGTGKSAWYDWIRGPVTKAVSRSNVYATMFNGNTTFTVNKGQITVNPQRNYKTVTVKGVEMISGKIRDFTLKIAKGTNYIRTNLSLPVAYKLK